MPRLVGTVETGNFYVRDLLKKRDFANTVIMGRFRILTKSKL